MSNTGSSEDSPADCAAKARALWLAPHPDMDKVEKLYRTAAASFLPISETNQCYSKKRRIDHAVKTSELEDWQRLSVEQLCMLLCQSGRAEDAKPYLQALGYTCRLASCLLNYPTTSTENNGNAAQTSSTKTTIPCCIWDNFLSDSELKHLQNVFLHPEANYWIAHGYKVEPPSPYFSYVIPLERGKDRTSITVDAKFGALGSICQKLHSQLIHQFPKLSGATAVEMWAHNRPHPTGHQFHFDSDNEGEGKIIKNPIISTILYLSNSSDEDENCVGGPSVVTNQSRHSRFLATKAWASLSERAGRMAAFDGTLLHGVIPGKGAHTGNRRVTLMLAFWRRIRIRKGDSPGAARPFPFFDKDSSALDNDLNWSQLLISPIETGHAESKPISKSPIPLDRVYETLDGEPWVKGMGFPEYDKVFLPS